MPAAFSRTLRSIEADRSRPRTALILAAGAVIALWLAWFFLGGVPVYEVADAARLEVKTAAHPVASRIDGQVLRNALQIGNEVKAGDVLVDLDSSAEALALAQGQARAADLRARLVAVRREVRAEEESAAAHLKAAEIAIEESKAHAGEAAARSEFAAERARNLARLAKDDAVSDEVLRQGGSEAAAARAALEALQLATRRLEQDRAVEEIDRRARVARLEREAVELEGLAAVEDASNRRLEREIELRRIRAPIDGRIGEASELSPGSVVRIGERLGSVVPAGEPRAVAFFPVAGVGRLREGQPARLRMDGFPWTRYGTLEARVSGLSSEPADGRVRVELALGENQGTRIPLEHGITGSAEVEVERLSPASLVLRVAGEALSTRRPAGQAGPD